MEACVGSVQDVATQGLRTLSTSSHYSLRCILCQPNKTLPNRNQGGGLEGVHRMGKRLTQPESLLFRVASVSIV